MTYSQCNLYKKTEHGHMENTGQPVICSP